MGKLDENDRPIEVWLTQQNINVECRVVFEDESVEYLDVNSLSMRGAQREITGCLIGNGYTPADRWENAVEGGDETVRRFQRGSAQGGGGEQSPEAQRQR
jgi:hypothetical protein